MPERNAVRALRLASLALAAWCLSPSGYAAGDDPARPAGVYVDDDYGFQVAYPGEGWQRGASGAVVVPGELCRCWSKGGVQSITVFRQNAGKAFTPRFLVDESAKAMQAQAGAGIAIKEKEVRTVAGMKAMWLVDVGPGTGGAIDGKGAVPTTQHWVAIPREKDVIVLLLTTPEADFATSEKTFETLLKTLKISGTQTDEQKASE